MSQPHRKSAEEEREMKSSAISNLKASGMAFVYSSSSFLFSFRAK